MRDYVPQYLERLAYRETPAVSSETLRGLHLAHMYSVPFENLAIHEGRTILLDDAALFDKIVNHRRGGFCYELNGLFAAVLRQLGFHVELLSAEVARPGGGFSPPFDHLALRVDLDEPWLADVGFGEGFRVPLRLNETVEQRQGASAYRIEADGAYRLLSRRDGNEEWKPQYRFTLQPHELAEFAQRCHFHQTSPDSHFTQNRICTRATPEGRITLSGPRLIVTRDGAKMERLLTEPDEYRAALRVHFGVLTSRNRLREKVRS